MFYYEARRKQLQYLLNQMLEYLNKIPLDSNTKGFLVILVHYFSMTFIVGYLVFGPTNKYYLLSMSILLFSLFINIYFHCCPILKLERILIEEPKWAGFYELLKFVYIEPTSTNIKITFWFSAFLLVNIIIFKKVFKKLLSIYL
jgi:hypothetical protein